MTEILDFVKAMSSPNRLRIIGLLAQKTATRAEIAARLEISINEAVDHLAYLEDVGAISQNGEGYTLNNARLATIAREKLAKERPTYIPAENLDEKAKRVLKFHLNPDGSIKQVPLQPAKLKVILDYLVSNFEVGKNYTEKEVNFILRRFNEDTSGLRRDLIEAGLLKRESNGSRYWKAN